MGFKEEWVDKRPNVDMASASHINQVAHGVIANEEKLKSVYTKDEAGRTFCNALVGKETGASISIEASPLQKSLNGKIVVDGALPLSFVIKTGKNLIQYPYSDGQSKVINGIYFSVDESGIISASGTATADAVFSIGNPITNVGNYFLSGCAPGGGVEKYYLSWENHGEDIGEGKTISESGTSSDSVKIVIKSGTKVNGIVFKPQIELGYSATEYERGVSATSYRVSEDGTFDAGSPILPTTTLVSNVANVSISIEYSMDINRVIPTLRGVNSMADIAYIVRNGWAKDVFKIGDQITVQWKDLAANVTYDVPLDVVSFENATLENGSVVPAMFLQWHYCSPFSMQFDHAENEQASESSFLSDYYYYEAYTDGDGNTRYKLLVEGTDYSVGDSIPTSKVYYHSSIKDPTGRIVNYGYSRWSHSAIRQFLNSKKGVNEWWTAQHPGDVAPDQLTTYAGFMSGFEEDFLSCIKPVKVTTALNTVTDTEIGTTEDTYDTFFLPSLEQIYAKTQLAGVEGKIFEYWKQAVGKAAPNGWYEEEKNPAYITYSIDTKISPQFVYLRSESIGFSSYSWGQNDKGAIYDYQSNSNLRFAPICAIC